MFDRFWKKRVFADFGEDFLEHGNVHGKLESVAVYSVMMLVL